jgi:hypothetical protein
MQANFKKVPVGCYGKIDSGFGLPAATASSRGTQSLPQENSQRNGETPVLHCWFAKPVLN